MGLGLNLEGGPGKPGGPYIVIASITAGSDAAKVGEIALVSYFSLSTIERLNFLATMKCGALNNTSQIYACSISEQTTPLFYKAFVKVLDSYNVFGSDKIVILLAKHTNCAAIIHTYIVVQLSRVGMCVSLLPPQDGRLLVGDRIISVNGESFSGISRERALTILTQMKGR